MHIAIVGSVNFDRIVTCDGLEKSSLGGILYNLLALAPLVGPDGNIYPLIRVGAEHWPEVIRILERHPNVDSKATKINPDGTNENRLVYTSETERKEQLIVRTSSFAFEELEPYLDSHLILFNFVTGTEISLDLLRRTRQSSRALIYIDVHSKVLGMNEDGTRYPNGWPDWEEWFQYADIVQMNLRECGILLRSSVESPEGLQLAARRIARAGPTQVIVTLGDRGAFVYWRNGDEQWELVPASAPVVLDTTGCGDCFTAGYVWGLFRFSNPLKATCVANVVAGENCRTVGLIDELTPGEIEEKTERQYPHLFHQ